MKILNLYAGIGGNRKLYYAPLLKPTVQIDRHLYWANFNISKIDVHKERIHNDIKGSDLEEMLGFPCPDIKNKRWELCSIGKEDFFNG